MDNFEFDLQLFAEVTVDLSTVKTVLTTSGTKKALTAEGWVNYTVSAPDGATATLVNGVLTVATTEDSTVTLAGLSVAELAGLQVSVGETAHDISIKDVDGSISAKTLNFTTAGIVADLAGGVSVTSAGVITPAASATIAVYGSMDDAQPTSYAISAASDDKVDITVSGDYVGVYKTVTLEGTTIALSTASAPVVKTGTETVAVAALKESAKLSLSAPETMTGDTEVLYYALTVDEASGQLQIGDGKAASVEVSGAKAFFKVTYKKDYGQEPSATIELVGVSANKPAATTAAVLLSGVTVDAAQLKTIPATSGAAVTNITVAAGVVSGAVNMTNVASTADVSIAGTTYKDDHAAADSDKNVVTYTPSYEVSTAANAITMDLSSMKDLTADGNKYFVVQATKDTTAGHGKMLYSLMVSDTEPSGENHAGYFKVAYANASGTYTLTFTAATGTGVPKALTATGWQDIVVNANGLASSKKLVITPNQSGDGTDDTHDNYKVTNAAVGLQVTKTEVTSDKSKFTVERAALSTEATIVIKAGEDTLATGIPLASSESTSAAVTTYWKVEADYEATNNGKPTITITKADAQPTSGSYLTVTTSADKKDCTVTYTNGANIALSGFTDSEGKTIAGGSTSAAQIKLNPANLVAGGTLTLSDDTAKVDYSIANLTPGITVTGVDNTDTVKFSDAVAYSNDIVIPLNGISATTYYKVNVAETASTSTGLKAITLGSAYSASDTAWDSENNKPQSTATYIAVTVTTNAETGAKTYAVAYNKGDSGPALVDVTTGDNQSSIIGGITVNATGLDNKSTVTLNTKAEDTAVTKNYTVTNVANGTTGPTITQDTGDAVIEYVGGEYVFNDSGNKISLATDDIGTKYVLSATGPAQGITTYALAAGVAADADISNASYFTTVYDSETKTVSVVFKAGTAATAVKLADFVANTADDKTAVVKVSGENINEAVTTLTLTSDDATGDVKYAVTGLPKTVTTLNAGTNDDVSNAYTATYEFAKDGNVITLGSTAGTVYYEVTSTGGQSALGVYTCTIGSALTPTGADDSAKLASIAGKNYFAVTTAADGKIGITYHKATGDNVTALALTGGLKVTVDPTNASAAAVITCGGSDDATLTYNVVGLSKGQTAAKASEADDTVTVQYNVSYEFDSSGATIALTKDEADALKTVYYTVERTDGATNSTTDQGVVKFKLTKLGDSATPSSSDKAYFMVKYSSQYQVNITYVNPTGADYDLTVDGVPQVTVDADGLSVSGVKIDTINVADTTGGDYNGVNYALTNVPSTISVIDTNNEDGKLDAKDTVSYKETAVLGDGASITIDPTQDVMYYAVTGTVTENSIICTVASTGTTTKPADTENYFVVTKESSGYKVAYQMANGTGYAFASGNKLTVNAKDVTVSPNTSTEGTAAPGSLTITVDSSVTATATVTNAAGGIKAAGGTISYNTAFAWAPGTYYVKTDNSTAITLADGLASGATVAGSTDTYAAVTVTKVTAGTGDAQTVTYKVALGNLQKPVGGEMVDTADTPVTIDATKFTIALDSTVKNFSAENAAYKAITGVTAGTTLSNAASVTAITTAELSSGDKVKLGDTEFISGGGELTFTGAGKVSDGTVLLNTAEAVVTESATTSADGINKVELVQAADTNGGVSVTFKDGEITAITGLNNGDQVNVYNGDTLVAHYRYKTDDTKSYIIKVAGSVTTYATAENGSTANLIKMEFATAATVPVGVFNPTTASTYYVDAGNSAAGNVTLAVSTTSKDAAESGHYYAKVVVGGTDGTISSISVVKGNSLGLVDEATDYTGTITVPAGLFTNGVVKYTGKADTAYKVAFTGVKTGSTFSTLDSDDTIVTDELAANATITIDGVAYKAVGEAQTFKFSGNKMTQGTVSFADTTAAHVLIAADGTKIAYASTEGTASGVTLEFGETGLTSLTGLSNGETVTLTAADGTETKYAGTASDGSVTRTVTKDGQSVTDTLTIPLDGTTQTNILAVTEGSGAKLNSKFTWATSSAAGEAGYFVIDGGSSSVAGQRVFTVAKEDSSVAKDVSDGMVVIKAESTYDATAGAAKLTLTPMIADAAGNLTETKLYGDTVKVTAPTDQKIVYNTSTTYKVAFSGVIAGSSLTINQEGSTVETASLTDGTSITVNGQTITNKAGSTAKTNLYIASSTDVRVVSGTIAVTGTMKSVDSQNNLVAVVTYTAGEENKDGVVVKFNADNTDTSAADEAGTIATITGLAVGESVTVTEGSKTTTYTAAMTGFGTSGAASKTVIWKTVTGSATATENVTTVQTIDNGVDVIAGTYKALADLKSTDGFSTQYNSTTPAVNTGYFLVDDDGSLTIADVTKDTTIATYQDAGKTLVKAVIASDGTLTLTKLMVGEDGNVVTSNPTDWTAATVTQANITITGSQTIKYAKDSGVTAVAITGVGAGSAITGIAAGDTVETASLTDGDTVTIGSTTYKAGGTGKLSFDGTAVKSGTFKIYGDSTTNVLSATNTNDSTKVTVVSALTYTKGTTGDNPETDGVNVTIANGTVTGITGLGLAEKVEFTETTTAKDGSQTSKKITYQAADAQITSGAQKGSIMVTKTEEEDGKVTTYTQNFSSTSLDVTKSTGWSVASASTTSFFQFGDTTNQAYTATGYFEAALNTTEDDADKGKYSATIAAQDSPVVLAGGGASTNYPKYYLKVTATKGTAGNVTFTEMELVALKANGAIETATGKELYSVALTAPASANIKLADHDFAMVITADKASNSTFSNVGANDVVKTGSENLAAGNYIVVNNKKYTGTGTVVEIKGDTIVSGTVKVEAGNVLTSSVDGSSIEYTAKSGTSTGDGADGVIVEFDSAGGIKTVKDLDAGEKVTITSADGTVTTYERDDTTSAAPVFTKTVTTQDGQTTVWTYTNSGAIDSTATTSKDVLAIAYGVSPQFSWPTADKETVGYFKVAASKATVQEVSDTTPLTVASSDQIVRVEVAKTSNGYAVKSLKLLAGPTLKDVTGVERAASAAETAKVAVEIKAPAQENITFAVDGAVVLPEPSTDTKVVDRAVQLNITGAKAGQTFTGLADVDTVTTGNLDAGAEITVNSTKFATAEAGTISVNGDGTAASGGFKLGKAYTINATDASGNKLKITMSGTNDDAMAVVVGGKLQSLYKLNAGETITVESTDKTTGAVSTITYTAEAGEGTDIVVTRKTVTDGVTTYETATIGDGADLLSSSVVYETTGTDNGVFSKFDWTAESGSGYFQLTDADGKLTADTLSVATQPSKGVKIDSKNAGEIYAKVSLSADNTLSGISLYEVQSDGTLKAVTALSGNQKVNVVITAPDGKLTADMTTTPANFANVNSVQILGVAAESIVNLRSGDSMTTASLTAASKTVTVNGTAYQAGGNTVLKFTNDGTDTVLQDGIVALSTATGSVANFKAAGAKSADNTDNLTVTVVDADTTDTNAATAVVTVVNGVVTNVAGLTGENSVTVVNGGTTATYKASGVAVTGATDTLTLATLAAGATVDVNGTKFNSGANDNNITVKVENTAVKVYSGVVTLTSQGASITLTDGDTTIDGTDDITVAYTTTAATAGTGTATVKVVNGTIQSITGLKTGEVLTVTDKSTSGITVTTTYTATTTNVTRAVRTVDTTVDPSTDTTVTTTATLLAGGDVFAANYYNSETGDADTSLVGQFSWNKDINGRAIGYFAVTEGKDGAMKATVAEQAAEVIVTPSKSGSKKYLVASAQYDEGTKTEVLTLGDILTIDSTGKVTTTALNLGSVSEDSTFTITAPSAAITFVKPATNVKVALKNLAAGSKVTDLIAGDTVTTTTLNAGDIVTVGALTYTAAAKGALTFIGEGGVVADTTDATKVVASTTDVPGAALLSGTVNLVATNSLKLAGSAKNEAGSSDDLTVTTDAATNIVVKAANGVVSSITGLTESGKKVTITNASGKVGSGKNAAEYSAATIVYTCVDSDGKMFKREIFKDADASGTITDGDTTYDVSYVTVSKSGGEIYTGAYKAASYTALSDLDFSTGEKAKTTTAYYKLATEATTADATTLVTATTATGLGDTLGTGDDAGKFLAEPEARYLVVKATTTTAGVTTISSVDGYEAGATGVLTKNAKLVYKGTLTIDGTQGMSDADTATYDQKYAVINYTLTKNGTFDVVATNVSYKSKFTNLGEGDKITTAAITDQALSSGTYNIYFAHDTGAGSDGSKAYTDIRTLVVKTASDGQVIVTSDANGAITSITNLSTKGESVTLTEQTSAGVATTVYEVKKEGVVTRTQTLADGTKSVATTSAAVTDATNILSLTAPDDWVSTVNNTVVSDFDWTLRKNATGYFQVANSAATAKTAKTTIATNTKSYIAVHVSNNGVVDSVEQVRFDTETGTMVATNTASATDTFSGKLTLTAPTTDEFIFDRTNALKTSIDGDNTTLAITGVIAGSQLTSLVNNDTVTTTKLKKETSVNVNGETYTVSSSGGALGFKVQDVDINGEEAECKVTLTSGTVELGYILDVDNVAGKGYVYVGKNTLVEVAANSNITVTASTNAKNVSTFTIGDIAENEVFKINGVTYQKSGTNLIRSYNDAEGAAVNEIYAIGSAKTVTSANLTKASNWKPVNSTLQETEGSDALTSKYGIVTVNLALADTRFAADKKTAGVATNATYGNTYDYVLDKYVNSATKASTKAALNGYVVSDTADWQSELGKVVMSNIFNAITNTTTSTYAYTANAAVAQAIKVAKNWAVVGSKYEDNITSASSGEDFIRAGAGKDTITLGGASDTLAFNLADDGQNTVIGYASGKDKIYLDDTDATTIDITGDASAAKTLGAINGDFSVHLGNTKDDNGSVYLYKDNDDVDGFSADDSYVMLKGMGNGKAVTINDKHFYFGNGYNTKAGATFAYEEAAYYVGNTSKKNALKVTTDKTKATKNTLGDDVTIDLMGTDAEGHSYYTNINTIDASASANRVVLSASSESGADVTLKGGTYQSTLKSGASNDTLQGGSGQDMFWFDDLSGSDTVKGYASDKDAVYIGGNEDLTGAGYTVSASGSDVLITKGDAQVKIAGAVNAAKAITVSKDGKIGSSNSVSYFVGKSGEKVSNTFTYVEGAYYVGNANTNDATSTKYLDTLKVTGTVKTKPAAMTAIDLTTSQYQSIEAVDASTLKAATNVTDTSTMGVDVKASTSGTRFTGTAYNDAFTCGAGKDYIIFKTNQGSDTITDFGQSTVEDVIKLNGLSKNEIDSVNKQIKAINTAGGTGTITFEGGGKLTFANAGTLSTITATNTTITSSTPTA